MLDYIGMTVYQFLQTKVVLIRKIKTEIAKII